MISSGFISVLNNIGHGRLIFGGGRGLRRIKIQAVLFIRLESNRRQRMRIRRGKSPG